ncbi:hypothetical protein N658DRAFT_94936 [Parathielavia hyrcaniae]|uniref:Uncharacterized protein n=1 Tax=Parathielavia hyrcaniae TaxID=113614 RepID=A0AAN6SVW0_9PEZI|nr:hypothetical protein N658DRAFT_94936 [Parathielavia hyrcaniae]
MMKMGRPKMEPRLKSALMPLMSAAQGTWPTNQRVDRHPGIANDLQAGTVHAPDDAHFWSRSDFGWYVRVLPLPRRRQQPSCHLWIHMLLFYKAGVTQETDTALVKCNHCSAMPFNHLR